MFAYQILSGINIVDDMWIPSMKEKSIPEVILYGIRNGRTTWERVICHLLCNTTRDGRISNVETNEIYNSIFSDHEIAMNSPFAAKDAMKEINCVKHWLYQHQIIRKAGNSERYFTSDISVIRVNQSAAAETDKIIIISNKQATDFSIEFLECVAVEHLNSTETGARCLRHLTDKGLQIRTEGGYLFHLRKYHGTFLKDHLNQKDANLRSLIRRGWVKDDGSKLCLNGTFRVCEYPSDGICFVIFEPGEDAETMQPDQKANEHETEDVKTLLIRRVRDLCNASEIDSAAKVHVEAVLRRTLKHLYQRCPDSMIESEIMDMLREQIKRSTDNPYLPYIMLLYDLLLNDSD